VTNHDVGYVIREMPLELVFGYEHHAMVEDGLICTPIVPSANQLAIEDLMRSL